MIREVLEQVISEDLADLWSVFTPEEKRLVMENFTLHHFKKNQVIYAEKDQPEMLWCLIRGKVKKWKEGIGGRSQIIRLIRPVQYFGYRAHFAGELYVSSASAFEQSTVGTLPLSIVDQLIEKNSRVALFFIHELARNLGSSDTKIVNLTQKHIRGRLAEALIVLIRILNEAQLHKISKYG